MPTHSRRKTAHPLTRILAWLVAVACCLYLGADPARANLVLNPGFEFDDTSAGPVSPPTDWTASGDAGAVNSFSFQGTNEAFLGIGTLSQSLPTVAGQAYDLSFHLAPDPTALLDSGASLTISFGGSLTKAVPAAAFPASTYLMFDTDVIAASTTSGLLFSSFTTSDAGVWYLDAISVTPIGGQKITEPGSGAIAVAAILGLWLIRNAKVRSLTEARGSTQKSDLQQPRS